MKVLIACEESQVVCKAFRAKGHEAYSADIQDCSGGHPEWHIKGDVLPIINGNADFVTMDGTAHRIEGTWDLIIAHPPCTYLTCTGNRWFNVEKYGDKARERIRKRKDAVDFLMKFADCHCPRVAIENPIGYISTAWRKPDQIIQPYEFGDPERKATCLWLKGLTLITPTNIVKPNVYRLANGKTDPAWHMESIGMPPSERAKFRSKTFPGIAKAMAEQWG